MTVVAKQTEPPSELWTKLTTLPRPSEVVPFPRKGPDGEPIGEVAIWVLTEYEIQSAQAEATKRVKALLGDAIGVTGFEGPSDLYQNAVAVEIVQRCCRRPENLMVAAFPSAREVRERLTMDEIGVLMDCYATIQAKFGPIVTRMTHEEVEALLRRIVASGNAVPLASLSRAALIDLAMHSASLLYSSSTDTSSPGEPPDESTRPQPPDGDASTDDA